MEEVGVEVMGEVERYPGKSWAAGHGCCHILTPGAETR
jgi:hypothetical protein